MEKPGDEIAFWPAVMLAAAIRRKKIGAAELLEHYIGRVERLNPRLNAIIATDFPLARRRAKAADRALAKGEVWGPLHGVPMTVKESFAALGLPTTWGIPQFKDNRLKGNAVAVDRLFGAGAVVFGKTNVPLWLADWQSANAIYGTTNNPWNVERVPGGSSGGSAAALAAGLTGLELGSDIGGSIRVPAHFCGVYGHKPTFGLLPARGQALGDWAAYPDIAVIGPMARSAGDLAVAVKALAGPDKIQARGYRVALPPPRGKALRDYRIAVVLDDPSGPVDRMVAEPLSALVEFLGERKARIDLKARPQIDTIKSYRIYLALLHAALSAGRSLDQMREEIEAARALARDDDSFRARFLRGVTMRHHEWLRLDERRQHLRRRWAEFFRDFDLLLCPVAPCTAFPHDRAPWERRRLMINGEARPYDEMSFWAGYAGVAYLPATVAPIGLATDGMPVGVQIVGPEFGDRAIIAFAELLEREYFAFVPPEGWA